MSMNRSKITFGYFNFRLILYAGQSWLYPLGLYDGSSCK